MPRHYPRHPGAKRDRTPYTAGDARFLARAMGLVPSTTPIESPQSKGMAEAFEKTFKRTTRGSIHNLMRQPWRTTSITVSRTVLRSQSPRIWCRQTTAAFLGSSFRQVVVRQRGYISTAKWADIRIGENVQCPRYLVSMGGWSADGHDRSRNSRRANPVAVTHWFAEIDWELSCQCSRQVFATESQSRVTYALALPLIGGVLAGLIWAVVGALWTGRTNLGKGGIVDWRSGPIGSWVIVFLVAIMIVVLANLLTRIGPD